jgi:hypothetical protein
LAKNPLNVFASNILGENREKNRVVTYVTTRGFAGDFFGIIWAENGLAGDAGAERSL